MSTICFLIIMGFSPILFTAFSALNFTKREHGLQIDQPPAIGNISSIMIVIEKNDNAKGILEFDPSYINITGMHIFYSLALDLLQS